MKKRRRNALPHLTPRGEMHMVDIGGKEVSRRRAIAESVVALCPTTRRLVATHGLPKGDLAPVVRLAAIQGAKEATRWVPLAHPIRLTRIDARFETTKKGCRIEVEVEAEERTGVEIEAMAGAMAGALALYDMVKGVERGATIGPVRLLLKEGGQSGRFLRK